MMFDDVFEKERTKYDRIWKHPAYHQWSPGEQAVSTFLNNVAWQAGETVVDLGCGTGRAAPPLAARGLKPTLLDFSEVGVEVFDFPFIKACLWDLPTISFDWIFSVDVLEHIPTDLIDQTLRGMARLTNKGGFLQIALFEDGCGSLIGERLHMTVQPSEWWAPRIATYWDSRLLETGTDARGYTGYAKFVLGEPHVC